MERTKQLFSKYFSLRDRAECGNYYIKNTMTGHLLLLRLAFAVVTIGSAASQLPANNPVNEPWIWPIPQEWQRGNATVKLSNDLDFVYVGHSDILQSAVDRYRKLIYLKNDYPMIPYNWSTTDNEVVYTLETIEINIQNWSEELDMDTDESYTLTIPISANSIINATTVFGALRAIETFSQIVQWSSIRNSTLVPNVPWQIKDYPKYKHRGLLLDTSRHYYSPKDMFKVLDSNV